MDKLKVGGILKHKYSKRLKNKTIPYAKVGQRVFHSLYDAESYCIEHNLNIDEVIEYGDSKELKSEVQKIALYQNAILSGVLDAFEKHKEKIEKELQLTINECNRVGKTRDLLLEYHKEQVVKLTAEFSGICNATRIIYDMKNNLELLTRK